MSNVVDGAVALTPTQQRVLDEVMQRGRPRPVFQPALSARLRAGIEEHLADVARDLGQRQLTVHKAALAQVHGCEGRYLAEKERGLTWSVPAAVGAVTHKAIELSVSLSKAGGLASLVDLAMDRLAEDERGPGPWLSGATDLERAEVRSGAVDRALKFEDEFPPVKPSWRPRLESTLLASLCSDRIVVRGKVDLALGQPRGTTSGVLIVDFKTGAPRRDHIDDLRFYALLETLRCGVPPFRVASWYLDSGHCHSEDVDEELLDAAARRLVDGARRMHELDGGRPATLQVGPACHYCPAADHCPAASSCDEDEQFGYRRDARPTGPCLS